MTNEKNVLKEKLRYQIQILALVLPLIYMSWYLVLQATFKLLITEFLNKNQVYGAFNIYNQSQ